MYYKNFNIKLPLDKMNLKLLNDFIISISSIYNISEITQKNIFLLNAFFLDNAEYIKRITKKNEFTMYFKINSLIINIEFSPFLLLENSNSIFKIKELKGINKIASILECMYQKKDIKNKCTNIGTIFKNTKININLDVLDNSYDHSGQRHARSFLNKPENIEINELSLKNKNEIREHIIEIYYEREQSIFIEPLSFFKESKDKLFIVKNNDNIYGAFVVKDITEKYKRIANFFILPEYDNNFNRINFLNEYKEKKIIFYSERSINNSIKDKLTDNWLLCYEDHLGSTYFKIFQDISIDEDSLILEFWKENIILFLSSWNNSKKEYFKEIIEICFKTGLTKINIICNETVFNDSKEYFEFLGFSSRLIYNNIYIFNLKEIIEI